MDQVDISHRYMTAEEAAAALGYAQAHVRLLCKQGKLRGQKMGRDWLIERAAVQTWKEHPPRRGPKGPRKEKT